MASVEMLTTALETCYKAATRGNYKSDRMVRRTCEAVLGEGRCAVLRREADAERQRAAMAKGVR